MKMPDLVGDALMVFFVGMTLFGVGFSIGWAQHELRSIPQEVQEHCVSCHMKEALK